MPSALTTDGGVQLSKTTAEDSNEVRRICDNRTLEPHPSHYELSPLTGDASEFENWRELLRKRAKAYRNFALVEAVTSVLKAANEARYDGESSLDSDSDKEDVCDDTEAFQDGVASLSDCISGDWNLLQSDDDSECILPFSSSLPNDTSDGRLASTPPGVGADVSSTDLHDRTLTAKLGDHARGNGEENSLTPIPAEYEELRGMEEKGGGESISHENGLDTTDLSSPKLPQTIHQQKLVEVRRYLNLMVEVGWDDFWKTAETECGLIPADVFAILLWMAEAVKIFCESALPTSAELKSAQLSPKSIELALVYSGGALAAEIIPKIRGRLQSTLGGAGSTKAEFVRVAKMFAATPYRVVLGDVDDASAHRRVVCSDLRS